MINYQNIEKIFNKLKNTDGGKNAEYIHELFIVNPELLKPGIKGVYK